MAGSGTEQMVDGRTARRHRNRDAVLDAVLELFSEGSLAPAAQDVAARSGVSLRSVYRYYEDMDDLVRQAIARNVQKARPLFAVDCLGEGTLEQRVDRLVDQRLRLHAAMAPTMRAALVQARTVERIREQVELVRERLLQQVRHMFEPELRALPGSERDDAAAALDVLLGFEAMERLRHQRGLDTARSRRVLRLGVLALLTGTTRRTDDRT